MSGASIALNIVRKQYREIREALVGDGMFTHSEVLQKALSVYDDSQELLKVQDRLAKAEQLIHELSTTDLQHYYWDGDEYRFEYVSIDEVNQ
tara:strand:+ start:143 stop:418 length:276 start_codon:yes stop_codon:yes gene_type:complete